MFDKIELKKKEILRILWVLVIVVYEKINFYKRISKKRMKRSFLFNGCWYVWFYVLLNFFLNYLIFWILIIC